jgi:flagellar basal-body rod protein FlgF
MLRGIYAAASSMLVQTEALNQTAANLANLNTPGYKRQDVVAEHFGDLVVELSGQLPGAAGFGVQKTEEFRHESQGPLVKTSNTYHLAISGEGYFEIQDKDNQLKVTRNGDFRRDNQGFLTTATGDKVLGVNNQPIIIPDRPGQLVNINRQGEIFTNKEKIAEIKIVGAPRANDPTFPAYYPANNTPVRRPELVQGYLENANVNVVTEMVNLMEINKLFTFGQKAITTQDNLLNKTMNDLGRLQ